MPRNFYMYFVTVKPMGPNNVGNPLFCNVMCGLIIGHVSPVIAMRALKESLRIPARMGWNGDPCAPTNWDAWEGVTCHPNKKETALVVSQM